MLRISSRGPTSRWAQTRMGYAYLAGPRCDVSTRVQVELLCPDHGSNSGSLVSGPWAGIWKEMKGIYVRKAGERYHASKPWGVLQCANMSAS